MIIEMDLVALELNNMVYIIILSILTICFILAVLFYYTKYLVCFNFKDGFKKAGLPLISLEHNGKTFNFIIDSGADTSTLNAKELGNFEYVPLEGDREIYGIDGKPIKIYFVGIGFTYKGNNFVEAFQVTDLGGIENLSKSSNIHISGIIGNSFLVRYKFLLNFNKLKAICKRPKHKKK